MVLKTEQIESYLRIVDAFNDKLNSEIPEKLQPLMSGYLKSMHEAGCDQHARDNAMELFSSEVHAIISDGLNDYLTIQYETFSLKSVMTEELGDILTRLESQYGESFQFSQKFLKDFIDNFSDQGKVTAYNEAIRQKGLETEIILSELMEHIERNCSRGNVA